MLIKFCDEVLTTIREYQLSYVKRLTTGAFKDFAEYQRYVGLLEGTKEAEKAIKKTYDAFTQSRSLASTEGDKIYGDISERFNYP